MEESIDERRIKCHTLANAVREQMSTSAKYAEESAVTIVNRQNGDLI